MTEDDRIAVYGVEVLSRDARRRPRLGHSRRLIAETSLSGLGLCLLTLQQEDEFPPGTRVGVFDRQTRAWLVNPWAGTSPWIPLRP